MFEKPFDIQMSMSNDCMCQAKEYINFQITYNFSAFVFYNTSRNFALHYTVCGDLIPQKNKISGIFPCSLISACVFIDPLSECKCIFSGNFNSLTNWLTQTCS